MTSPLHPSTQAPLLPGTPAPLLPSTSAPLHIFVTDCAGFIGWKVSEMLLEQGHIVVGMDNLNDAYDVRLKGWWLALWNMTCLPGSTTCAYSTGLAQLEGEPGFEFHRLDITDREALAGGLTRVILEVMR